MSNKKKYTAKYEIKNGRVLRFIYAKSEIDAEREASRLRKDGETLIRVWESVDA